MRPRSRCAISAVRRYRIHNRTLPGESAKCPRSTDRCGSVESVQPAVLPVVVQHPAGAARRVHLSWLGYRVDDVSARVEDGEAQLDGAPLLPVGYVEAVERVVGTCQRVNCRAVAVEEDLRGLGTNLVVRVDVDAGWIAGLLAARRFAPTTDRSRLLPTGCEWCRVDGPPTRSHLEALACPIRPGYWLVPVICSPIPKPSPSAVSWPATQGSPVRPTRSICASSLAG